MIFFSRADRTLTDHVTTAGGEPQLEKATPVCRNNHINGLCILRIWDCSKCHLLDICLSYMCFEGCK
jgi:hypothetical protein